MRAEPMKSQDIVVLLKLVCLQDHEHAGGVGPFGQDGEDPYSVRGLETSLGISKTEVAASIKRSLASGMAIKRPMTSRPDPNRRNLRDFITYGLKFVFPASPGPMQRGMPTAFAAPVLKDLLYSAGSLIHVWPYARGREMGQSVAPLFKTVPKAAERDDRLYAYLALVDAIRLGNQREASLAANLLKERLG
ncbi:hypothetical protein GCM10010987_63530 [Bradyrhizobium guangdongense]|uniref:Uncharacterized protein n=4 Tax=Bradyrhizobium TaxID=374 RepID=A0AA87WC15_9BRAD|nr:hypothetical protein GCM10010987_63530 [Bradyrhizobium guangdongense]